MPSTLLEITGVFRRERIRFDSVIIGEISEHRQPGASGGDEEHESANGNGHHPAGPTVIKGEAEPDSLTPGLTYRFYGRRTTHPKHGDQFHFQTFIRSQPHGQAGIVRYLSQAPFIGSSRARKLWDRFQSDAVRILREQPEVAAAAIRSAGDRNFNAAMADEAATWLAGEVALESCSIDLIDLLGGRGFPKKTAKKAVNIWGNRAAELIRKNPYLLMHFRGCGFLRTDAMWLDLGLPPFRLKRQAYCAWHAIASDSEGHTWLPRAVAVEGIQRRIGGTELAPDAAIMLAERGHLVAGRHDVHGRPYLAEFRKAEAEQRTAEYIAAALLESRPDPLGFVATAWPSALDVDGISDHQRERLAEAITNRVGLLTGSPGTGKTYAVACLARAIVRAHGDKQLAIAAPTGKAAVRVTEAMQGYGLPLRAKTIHSLLRIAQKDEGHGDGWGFEHREGNPLPFRFIIVDESSMVDCSLMSSLLAARAAGTHVLFVGDPNQLPPVGHGAPLRDFIGAGLPCGELREIRRNSGTIVQACAEIRDGKLFRPDKEIDLAAEPSAKNLKVVDAPTVDAQIGETLNAIRWAARELGLNPVWDVQVLCAVNAKSDLSRRSINQLLQEELNKSGKKVGGNPFRVGDKIVCLKNGFLPLNKQSPPVEGADGDNKVFVANGELAEVIEVEERLTVARLSGPDRIIDIPRGGEAAPADEGDGKEGGNDAAAESAAQTGCNWDLGYGLSVHKAQGAEFPVVVVLIDEYPGARMVCTKNWIYTAISRAKKACLLVGKKATADGYCRRDGLKSRQTFLSPLILEELKQREDACRTVLVESVQV